MFPGEDTRQLTSLGVDFSSGGAGVGGDFAGVLGVRPSNVGSGSAAGLQHEKSRPSDMLMADVPLSCVLHAAPASSASLATCATDSPTARQPRERRTGRMAAGHDRKPRRIDEPTDGTRRRVSLRVRARGELSSSHTRHYTTRTRVAPDSHTCATTRRLTLGAAAHANAGVSARRWSRAPPLLSWVLCGLSIDHEADAKARSGPLKAALLAARVARGKHRCVDRWDG